ncbi:MAG: c-type cytochrome [Verrucomicrobia bacterium]|nr:c-type cytochrome [Verrucomicrobiota bacterium]
MKTKGASSPVAIIAAVILTGCAVPLRSNDSRPDRITEESARGKRLFQGHCARCHGIQATGGFGPSLAQPKLRNAPDQAALIRVIRNGIPDTAMPGAWQISDGDARLLASYVRTLGKVVPRPMPGDAVQGRAIYEGKGTCATCHRIQGQGGVTGPDLTSVGRRRGPEYLRQALVDPGAALPEVGGDAHAPPGYAQFLPVRVLMREGREIQGIRLNEDDFTIQLRDADHRIHSLRKSELSQLQKEFGKSPMPSYESVLTPAELDDLIAYLASLRGDE